MPCLIASARTVLTLPRRAASWVCESRRMDAIALASS